MKGTSDTLLEILPSNSEGDAFVFSHERGERHLGASSRVFQDPWICAKLGIITFFNTTIWSGGGKVVYKLYTGI